MFCSTTSRSILKFWEPPHSTMKPQSSRPTDWSVTPWQSPAIPTKAVALAGRSQSMLKTSHEKPQHLTKRGTARITAAEMTVNVRTVSFCLVGLSLINIFTACPANIVSVLHQARQIYPKANTSNPSILAPNLCWQQHCDVF